MELRVIKYLDKDGKFRFKTIKFDIWAIWFDNCIFEEWSEYYCIENKKEI